MCTAREVLRGCAAVSHKAPSDGQSQRFLGCPGLRLTPAWGSVLHSYCPSLQDFQQDLVRSREKTVLFTIVYQKQCD